MEQPFLRQRSIRRQIVGIVMMVSATVLTMASMAFLTWDYFQFRSDMRRELSIQAQMVLENSTAAISFDDRAAARATIQTLSPNMHIRLACLYTPSGTLFTEFRSPSSATGCPIVAPSEGYSLSPNRLQVVEGIQVAQRPGGSLLLRSDLDALSSRLRIQALTTASMLAVALIVAFVLSSSLQRVISEPVNDLARTAREVSSRGDYGLRASKSTSDELDVLVDAFNEMLGQIQRAQGERLELLQRERDANRLKDEFLMTLSHELRTPLNAILGWTRMLRASAIPQEETSSALEKIERNAVAQTRLIEDLLDISRFTTGKFRLERQSLDLVAVANDAIEAIQPNADARHVQIEKRFAEATLESVGDPERLQQVVWNLLSNAVKFSPAGSRVIVSLRRRGGVVELMVSDAGEGIDPAFLPQVFDPFRQADATTTRSHGGLGLGLSIVRRIVELHDGHVFAASQGTGLGATFTVRLPVVQAEAIPTPRAESTPPVPSVTSGGLAGVKVLVVDDDTDSRDLLVAVLGASGAAALAASSTAEALQLSIQSAPDALITDLAMPGQDGYVLLARLKDVLGPAMPRVTIALTAQAGERDKQKARSAGFRRHVAKPFDPLKLVDLVKELMSDPVC